MEVKFIITIVTLAVAFAGFGVAAICYLYVCRRICKEKNKKSSKVGASPLPNGYPKVPLLKSVARDIQIVQMMQRDQYSRYTDLNQTNQKMSSPSTIENEHDTITEGKPRRKDGYRKLDRAKSQQLFFFDKSPLPYQLPHSDDAITQNHYPQTDSLKTPPYNHMSNVTPTIDRRENRVKYSKRPRRSLSTQELSSDISQLIKNRYKSESDITMFGHSEYDEGRSTSSSSSVAALSVMIPAEGQVEFRLYYNSDNKLLDITINRLSDIYVDPSNFIGILETVRLDHHEKPKGKVYLKEHENQSIELVTCGKTGYLVYVSIPELQFKRNTNVSYGAPHVTFNEVFTLSGNSIEDLYQLVLCIHVLIKFSDDIDPIIIGEVKVPLQMLQPCQSLPFSTEMTAPQFELELCHSPRSPFKEACLGELQVVVSFNPMISQLVVKIVQATGLPKITMTGHPNVSVKASLYCSGRRLRKISTAIHRRQKEPVFNESLQFDISKDRIADCDLLLEVRHHGPMHRSVIGYVIIGKSASKSAGNHWRQLLEYSHFEKLHRIEAKKPPGLEYNRE